MLNLSQPCKTTTIDCYQTLPAQSGPLSFNSDVKHPSHALPFVNSPPSQGGVSFWAVPQTGGPVGGAQAGRAMATLYLKHLKEHSLDDGGTLPSIVRSMLENTHGVSSCPPALRGQIVGFFSVIDHWLHAAVSQLNTGLNALSDHDLLAEANSGLAFDYEALMAEINSERGNIRND